MGGWAVIPSIRVRDLEAALAFYRDILGFVVERGDGANRSLTRCDARIMLEAPSEFYSPDYNAAIVARLGSASPNALYMEAPDLEELYRRVQEAGAIIADPLAERPWGQFEFTLEDLDGNWLTFWKAIAGQ
jgi:uncharacterized glyoxalase superfamily protein PhnB